MAEMNDKAPDGVDRAALLRNVRSVVIKIGTNALSDAKGRLDTALLAHIAEQVAAVRSQKKQVTLVSSGAIGAGVTELGLPGRPKDLPMLQAAASVGQSILMRLFGEALRKHELHAGQILITRSDFEDRQRYLNLRNCIHALQNSKCVPIVNENDSVAVAEIKFGDNDLIAAHVTNLLRADLLILLSVVDGLLDGEGKTIPLVHDVDDASGNVDDKKRSAGGSGGMGSKLFAAGTVRTAGEPVLIANGKRPNVITDLLAGANIGTLIMPASKKLSSRSRWIGLTAKNAHGGRWRRPGAGRKQESAGQGDRGGRWRVRSRGRGADPQYVPQDARPRPDELLARGGADHHGPQIIRVRVPAEDRDVLR